MISDGATRMRGLAISDFLGGNVSAMEADLRAFKPGSLPNVDDTWTLAFVGRPADAEANLRFSLRSFSSPAGRQELSAVYRGYLAPNHELNRDAAARRLEAELDTLLAVADPDFPLLVRLKALEASQRAP